MSLVPHIADAETEFSVRAITPDFCRVGKDILPFFPAKDLKPEKTNYSMSVFARDEPILLLDSVVNGVKGNMGSGILSGVSQKDGHVQVISASSTVYIEDRKVARHGDLCLINVRISS